MAKLNVLLITAAIALTAAVTQETNSESALPAHAPEYDEVAEMQLLELAFRARLHADSLAAAHAEVAAARTAKSQTTAESGTKASAEANWRFGGNFSPQHYGQWRMVKGTWNFGNDKRMECEACAYVLYMLIDRLGDQFSRVTIEQEAELLCPRVQWVYKSACDFIVRRNKEAISDLIMKLVEPVDICKHLTLCPPDYYDMMGVGGMQGYGNGRSAAMLPPQFRGAPGVLPPQMAQPYFNGQNPLMYPGTAPSGYDMYGNALPAGRTVEQKEAAAAATAATGE